MKGSSGVPRGPKGETPPTKYCDGCERITPHECGMVMQGGLTHSRFVCRECGLEKIGGRIATRS